MAKNNPRYIRLNDRLSMGGNQHDLVSGFGISGFDVKEWPEGNRAAEKFCREKLRLGVFEEASKGEFEEVQSSNPEYDELPAVRLISSPAELRSERQIRRDIVSAGEKVAQRAAVRQKDIEDEDDEELAHDDNVIERAGDAQAPTRAEKAKARSGVKTTGKKTGKKK